MLGGLLCPRGGLGTDAAVEGLFMPTWCCCCGEHQLAVGWEWWDRTMEIGSAWYKEIESNGLNFFVSNTANFPSIPCLITPIPQHHQLPTAATSRGHNSPPTAASVPNPPRVCGSQLDLSFLAVGSHNFFVLWRLWNSLSSLKYHSASLLTYSQTHSALPLWNKFRTLTEHSFHTTLSGNMFTILWLFAGFFF